MRLLATSLIVTTGIICTDNVGLAQQAARTLATREVRQALAPTGTLRIGVFNGPTSMITDARGNQTGFAYEVGKELARRLGLPFEVLPFRSVNDVLQAQRDGGVDFTTANPTPERAKTTSFYGPVLRIEVGYLVAANSGLSHASEVDRPGMRVGTLPAGPVPPILARELRQAQVVTVPSAATVPEMLTLGTLDAFASTKPSAPRVPGARMLPGRAGIEELAAAVPTGREQGAEFLRELVKTLRAEGFFNQAIDRAGLQGVLRD